MCRSSWRSTRSTRRVPTRQRSGSAHRIQPGCRGITAATRCSSTSLPSGINIQALEEAVLLTADAALDLRANPDMEAQGVAIEAHLDRGRGPVATVLVQRGTLRVGDSVVAGDAYGRVRRMVDEHGDDVEERCRRARFRSSASRRCPVPGDNFLVVAGRGSDRPPDRGPSQRPQAYQCVGGPQPQADQPGRSGFGVEGNQPAQPDPEGRQRRHRRGVGRSALGYSVDDEVELRVIDRGVGGVTETNVNLASASDAIIIGFNVRAEGKATELANREGVEIRYYSVIYQAIDEIESALKGMLKPIYEERSSVAPRFAPSSGRRRSATSRAAWVQSGSSPQRQGLPPRQCRGRREPHGLVAQAREGRRDRGSRGLSVV